MILWDMILRDIFVLFCLLLKKALEKNQQWLVYDQQREAYVKGVLAEKYQLEQELHQAKKALQQREIDSEGEIVIMSTLIVIDPRLTSIY